MKSNGNEYEYVLKNAHQNKVEILNRRIADLEKEVFGSKNKLLDAEDFIVELLSYKKGLEKENRDILKNQIPKHLRDIDSECLTTLK